MKNKKLVARTKVVANQFTLLLTIIIYMILTDSVNNFLSLDICCLLLKKLLVRPKKVRSFNHNLGHNNISHC